MNQYFDEALVEQYFPEAGELMIPNSLIWKLPENKKNMLPEICGNGQYFLEEKIDGIFYQFAKTKNYSYLFGRTISKTNGLMTEKSANVPHILSSFSCLPPNTVIIGEIYVPGGTAKDAVSIMGCLPELAIKKQENDPIHYYLHDIIKYDGVNLINVGAEDRYKILAAIYKKFNFSQYPFLRLATKVDTNLEAEIHKILANGGEGAVLKKRDSIYTPGKRPAWQTIKIKQNVDSLDLICIGFCCATKVYTGKEIESWPFWEKDGEKVEGNYYGKDGYIPLTKPYFLGWNTAIELGVYDEKGKLVKIGTVSSGLTDEMKEDMTNNPENYLNKVVSVSCMSIDREAKTLRHPSLVTWREDKNSSECTLKGVFE